MGFAYQSPLARWEVLAGLCQEMNARHVVEVGTKDGRTTAFLLANLPDVHVTAVDPWAPVPNADEDYRDWDFSEIEKTFWQNVGAHRERCTMLRMTSAEAARQITSADLVFIDAGHDFDNALLDIQTWWPRVRENGYLCGHDYQHKFPGVMRAVAKSFPLLRVAVCPDSVWVVQKERDLRLAA